MLSLRYFLCVTMYMYRVGIDLVKPLGVRDELVLYILAQVAPITTG